jgi:hypothetical protein
MGPERWPAKASAHFAAQGQESKQRSDPERHGK